MIDPRIDMFNPDFVEKLIALRDQYHSRAISEAAFLASLSAFRITGRSATEMANEATPDPLQPDADTIRLEASRRWLKTRLNVS